MTIPKFGLKFQPFSKNIEVGRLNKAGNLLIGELQDVTHEVLHEVAAFVNLGYDGGMQCSLADGSKLTIKVEKPSDSDE